MATISRAGTSIVKPRGFTAFVKGFPFRRLSILCKIRNNVIFTEILARCTSIQEAVEKLRAGTLLWKVRDKGVRGLNIYRRKFKLDLAELKLIYLPNKSMTMKNCVPNGGPGGSPNIELTDIAEVRIGHSTDTMNKIVKQCQAENKSNPIMIENVNCHRDFCFSLVFKDDTPPLDLVANDEETRNLWVDVLSHLIVTITSLGQQNQGCLSLLLHRELLIGFSIGQL